MNRKLKFLVSSIIVSGTIYSISELIFMRNVFSEAVKDYNEKCKYLLILGSEVTGESTPCDDLICRIKRAESYLKDNPDVIAVPCGGCFRPKQKISEAKIIKNYLINYGINEKRIILEDKSTTTIENFRFAKKIIETHCGKDISSQNIAVLTSDYHLYRATLIAKYQGFYNIKKVTAKTNKDFNKKALREVIVAPQLIMNLFQK